MTPQDEILAILCGAIKTPPSQALQLANTFLGTSLGALTDLGKTDEEIIRLCQLILSLIRRAQASPETVADLVSLQEKLTR